MTKVIVQKIAKKSARAPVPVESMRSKRFKALLNQHGAVELEQKIDGAIKTSEQRRARVKKDGKVAVAVVLP